MSQGIRDIRSLYAAAIGHSASDEVLTAEEQGRLMERFQLVLAELDRFRSVGARAQRVEMGRIQTKFQAAMGRPGLKTREGPPKAKPGSSRQPEPAPPEGTTPKDSQPAPEASPSKSSGKSAFSPARTPPKPMPPKPGQSRR